MFNKLSSIFLSSRLKEIGLDQLPIQDENILNQEKQTIGYIKLRLSPPIKFRSLKDLPYLILNHEFLRLILVALWLIICGLIESFMAQLSDMRYNSTLDSTKHPLRDLLHDAFPKVTDVQIVNYLLTATIVYTVIGFILQSPDWSLRFLVLRRWGFIMGFIYVFRGICLLVTTLPSSLIDECRPPEIELTGTTAQRFAFLLDIISGTALTCTDNIFSGHTSMMMSCVMIWRVHSRTKRVFSWILYLIATAGILLILFTRFHYSIDVLLAIYITYTSWDIYLRYVQEASLYHVFGFTNHSTMDLYNKYLKMSNPAKIYEYLNFQPHPIGKKWLMNFIMYADGLDIRLRALQNQHNDEKLHAIA